MISQVGLYSQVIDLNRADDIVASSFQSERHTAAPGKKIDRQEPSAHERSDFDKGSYGPRR